MSRAPEPTPAPDPTQTFLMRHAEATFGPGWPAWWQAYQRDPASAIAQAPRGDWILAALEIDDWAEENMRRMTCIAYGIVEEHLPIYQRYDPSDAPEQLGDWISGDAEYAGVVHQSAHAFRAAAYLMEGLSHLAHAGAHVALHPACAVQACILAAEVGDFARGRVEGKRHAETETADMVRMLLGVLG